LDLEFDFHTNVCISSLNDEFIGYVHMTVIVAEVKRHYMK